MLEEYLEDSKSSNIGARRTGALVTRNVSRNRYSGISVLPISHLKADHLFRENASVGP